MAAREPNARNLPAAKPASDRAASGGDTLTIAAILGFATLAAYANTFPAPFVFDDISSIVENPTIRRLWPPTEALRPLPGWGFTVSGRPVLNASFAVNYAISGLDVWSYHALNLAIHVGAGLTFFGLVRRTLQRPLLADLYGRHATGLAAAIAGVWMLHPLQTESVTYVVQRAESLMGLFFLLSLYGFVRSVESSRSLPWATASFLACLLGVATKEVAALVPLMVFLYDRTFVSGSFRAAGIRHRWRHLALVSTWLPLAWLLAGTGGNRGGTVGFDIGVSAIGYWLTQFEAVVRYLWLSFWPHPLVFDYGKVAPPGTLAAALWALPVVVAVAATIVALRRWPVAGFAGAWFFGILAPTSIVPGAIQMIVEHRMYLPLAAVVTLFAGLLARYASARHVGWIGVALGVACGAASWHRNSDYATELRLWEDTLTKRPGNARAHNNVGTYLLHAGRLDEALVRFHESLRLDPGAAHTHYNLGLALMQAGRPSDAMAAFKEAVRILPHYFQAHLNLGTLLTEQGRPEEAIGHLEQALLFASDPVEGHFRLGVALAALGRWRDAGEAYAKALAANPRHAQAHSNWGVALFSEGRTAEAMAHFRSSLAIEPELPDVHFNFGLALAATGQVSEAITHFREAVRLDPAHAVARLNLGIALGQTGELAAAIEQLRAAADVRPDLYEAHANLGVVLSEAGHGDEALAAYEAALRLRPDDPRANYNVGYAQLSAGRRDEAERFLERALALDPTFTAARELLRRLRE